MTPVYMHGDNAYVILRQKPIHHFCKTFEDQPNMEYVQQFMQWLGADHVLRNNTHFMFCETIADADFENID